MSEPKITPQESIHYARVRIKHTFQHLEKTENGWQIRCDRTIEGFDSLVQKWKNLRVETYFEPLETHGYLKEIEFNVLFFRTTTDRDSLLDLRAFFVQPMKISIPDLAMFKDIYVSLENQTIYISELSNQTTMPISLSLSGENRFAEFLSKIGDAKRLTDKQALKMRSEPNTLGVYSEDRDGNFTSRSLMNVRVSARGE